MDYTILNLVCQRFLNIVYCILTHTTIYNIVKEGDCVFAEYEEFFAQRLCELREKKGVSARSMSLSIGQNANYINQIENKKTFPSMQNFFYICDYLDVTPYDFFDPYNKSQKEIFELLENIRRLSEEDFQSIYTIIKNLTK